MQTEIVCDYGDGEWDGDSWVMGYHDHIQLPWILNKDGGYSVKRTANALIHAAQKKCNKWSRHMAELDDTMERLYKEQDSLPKEEGDSCR